HRLLSRASFNPGAAHRLRLFCCKRTCKYCNAETQSTPKSVKATDVLDLLAAVSEGLGFGRVDSNHERCGLQPLRNVPSALLVQLLGWSSGFYKERRSPYYETAAARLIASRSCSAAQLI